MGEVSIFRDGAVATTGKREISALGKTLAAGGTTTRRIQTNTNGTFKRLINGEQIGDAVRSEINVVIVGALPSISRVYYAKTYDPNGEPTLPNCWSNLGDVPEAAASNKQSESCKTCPQNIKGSGGGDRRACRYQRRVSVLLEGDPSGDVYQLNIPAKSLFGKGSGNTHPFESYVKFLLANGESPDTVVTTVAYNLNADSMELNFTPRRNLTDAEYLAVQEAQARPETQTYLEITVAQASAVSKHPAPARVVGKEEPDNEPPMTASKRTPASRQPAAPTPTSSLSAQLDSWANEDD